MSRLLLHIGLHKTGTTAIQHFFRDNIQKYQMKGFGILNPGENNGKYSNLEKARKIYFT